MRRTIVLLCVGLGPIVLTGCGSAEEVLTSEPAATVDTAAPNATFNDDDVMFAQMMIPHHEQALEMADIALDPTVGAGAQVKDLAERIRAAQEPEIDAMTSLLVEWDRPTAMDESMDHSEMMGGMLTADELTELGTLRGADFDRAWLAAMIRHHEGAIDMANDVRAGGVNPSLASLAGTIATSQQAEITEMNGVLASLG